MYTLGQKPLLKCAVAAGLVVLCVSGPAGAGELIDNLGPVGAHEPILTSLGDKRVIAFYQPDSERCALHAVMWDNTGADAAKSAARVRVSLEPGQVVHVDTPDNKTLNLQCGNGAETLSISDDEMTSEAPGRVMKAQASDF
jgi:hypothetical protein